MELIITNDVDINSLVSLSSGYFRDVATSMEGSNTSDSLRTLAADHALGRVYKLATAAVDVGVRHSVEYAFGGGFVHLGREVFLSNTRLLCDNGLTLLIYHHVLGFSCWIIRAYLIKERRALLRAQIQAPSACYASLVSNALCEALLLL